MNKKNPMKSVLDIRLVREEQASREFGRRKRAVMEAVEALERRVAEASEFSKALARKEDAFIETMLRQSHATGAVRTLKRELENWRHRLVELLGLVENEKSNVAKAEEQCAFARAAFQAKTKEKVKTETFAETWEKAFTKEQEAREEIELEDRLPKKNFAEESMETENA
jgi:flagellar biosynthesis chaperone FliJ